MDKRLLVQLFVPTTDPEGKGSIGTGYSVDKDRILTARHVVLPKNRDTSKPIEIRWYHLDEPRRGWRPCRKILWDSSQEDVAVIECPFPNDITRFAELDDRQPETGNRWESEGFARAGKREDNSSPPVGLKGESYSMGGHGVFELGVDDPAIKPDLWQGASGSPVFVDGKIQGVIITTPTNFPANRFAAAPMWRLLKDSDFRQAVNFQQPLVKRNLWFLCQLVKTNAQNIQINRLIPKGSHPVRPLACVFADFTVECPDSLAFKLLHQLNSANHGEIPVSIAVDFKRGMNPDEWLWRVMKEPLQAYAPTHAAIQEALQDGRFEEPTVFVLNFELDQSLMENRPFIAGLIQAWHSLTLKDRCHCLLLLQSKEETPNLWHRWRLARWAKAMGHFLGEASDHLICPDASPAIHPSHGDAWIAEIAGQDFNQSQTHELHSRWDEHFKSRKPRRYSDIRLTLKADLIAVKA
ncbi:MAG: serine protease [Methylococcus sp.]